MGIQQSCRLLLRSSTSPKSLEEALESANKAIAIDSAIPTFYFNRAIIKYNMNDLDGAMDHSRTLNLMKTIPMP